MTETITFNLSHILGAAAALAIAVVCGYWAIANLLLKQFEKRLDERFTAQEAQRIANAQAAGERIARLEASVKHIEGQLNDLRVALPSNYVSREDWIRFAAGVDVKLDHLRTLLMEGRNRGD